MEILHIKGVRILDDEFRGLLETVCGLQQKGGAFQACGRNPGVCDQLLRFLALKDLSAPLIATGVNHTCAVKANGDLVCWGSNYYGQCDVPPDLGPVMTVAAGLNHTCAVKANGDIVLFGNNWYGQCDVPPDLGPVAAMAAGGFHTCAVKANGDLVCFGNNDVGQCDVPEDLGPVVAVEAGDVHTCAVKANGDLVCFGSSNDYGQCDVPPDLGPVVAVAAGSLHTCAVKDNGDLVCWGSNHHGQCDFPPDLGPVVAVAAGMNRTCAIKANGDLVHFGGNVSDDPPDLGPVAVIATTHHTCAVKATGDLICFGNNRDGQCDVPPDLGTLRFAASSFERCFVPGPVEPAVVQRVDHSGPAALIPADEAAAIVAQQEASFIEHNINSVTWGAATASQSVYRVVLLHFSRAPAQMRDALQHSEGLRPVFDELAQAGLNWMLPSGTKILVPPHVYHMLLNHLNCNSDLEQQLHSSHILVSEELQAVVMAAVGELPSRLRVRLADYDTFTLSDAASSADSGWSVAASGSVQPWGWSEGEIVLSRTFLELRPTDIADDVTHSTGRGGNPRLAVRRAESF